MRKDLGSRLDWDKVRTAFWSYRWVILAVAVIGQTGLGAATQGIPVLANFYKNDFAITMGEVGLFTAAIGLGTAVPAILCGLLADRFGVRLMLTLGLCVVGASILLLSMAPSYAVALPLAFFAGVGHAMCSPAAALAVVHWFDAKGRGTAMGIKQAGIPICGIIAAASLPAVALAFNWRFSMALLGLAPLLLAAVVFALYRKPASALPMHLSARVNGNFRMMLRNRNIWRIGAFAFVLVGAQNSLLTYFILYFRDTLSLPVTTAGALLSIAQMTGLVARIGDGVVSDMLFGGRRKPVLAISGALAVITLGAVGLFGGHLNGWLLAAPAVVLGVCVLGWHGVWVALATEIGGKDAGGTALGISTTFSQVGGSVTPLIFGLLLDATGSYQVAWVFLASLAAIGTLAIAGVKEKTRP